MNPVMLGAALLAITDDASEGRRRRSWKLCWSRVSESVRPTWRLPGKVMRRRAPPVLPVFALHRRTASSEYSSS